LECVVSGCLELGLRAKDWATEAREWGIRTASHWPWITATSSTAEPW